VLILADDFGVGDIQAHYPDNKIATPYLDKLVQEGMSFTDAHSPSAVCTPTRYGLLTGRYSWRTRLQEWVLAAYEPPLIADDRPTLPGMLRDHGYETALIGKWHLGWEWPGPQPSQMTVVRNGQKTLEWHLDKPVLNGPTTRGFDYYFGVDLPNMPPFSYVENDIVSPAPTSTYVHDESEGVVLPRGFVGSPMAPGWRLREIVPELTRRAVEQIRSRAQSDKPFFLFYSMTSPHEPISPSPAFQDKSGIAPIADFVMETDWSAGQVIQAVDEAGIADDTIVIFTADNGHSHYTGWEPLVEAGHMPSGPYRGHKGDIWEGGHLVPLVVPLAVSLSGGTAGPPVLATVGAILAGACFGDHISPISDTTILSATASGVEVITHVRTQLPYALTVGAVSLCLGYLPAGFGVPPLTLLPLGVSLGAALVWVLGRTSEADAS